MGASPRFSVVRRVLTSARRGGACLLAVAIACCISSNARAAAALPIAPLAKPPAIDGILNDAEWAGARVTEETFVQIEPAYGEASPFRNVVRVGQTPTALYVAVEAFDPE